MPESEKITIRIKEMKLKEIDEAWTTVGFIETRSAGIKWLIEKGLNAIKKEQKEN